MLNARESLEESGHCTTGRVSMKTRRHSVVHGEGFDSISRSKSRGGESAAREAAPRLHGHPKNRACVPPPRNLDPGSRAVRPRRAA